MSLPLKLNFSDYDNFLTDPNYTTSAEVQDYFRNMDMLVEALIDVGLWQPETNYPNGHVVFSPNMPNGTEAVCVATNGGKSSNTEPSWGEVGGDNVSDGTCFWKLRWKHWSKSVEEIADLTTGATNRLPNKAYAVGNVVYTDSNLSVALRCTTTGTTSNTELDISGRAVGESVEDGSVAWEVVARGVEFSSLVDKTFTLGSYSGGGAMTIPNGADLNDLTAGTWSSSGTNVTQTLLNVPQGVTANFRLVHIQNTLGWGMQLCFSGNNNKVFYRGLRSDTGFLEWQELASKNKLSMPSDTAINIAFEFSEGTTSETGAVSKWEAPADGYIDARYYANADNWKFQMATRNSAGTAILVNSITNSARSVLQNCMFIPISKGQTLSVSYKGITSITSIKFVYSQSEV